MGNFFCTTISLEDLQSGDTRRLLAEADVVVAVDVRTGEEEAILGGEEWDRARETAREDELAVLRIELDTESDDPDTLAEVIEEFQPGELNEDEGEQAPVEDVDDD